MVLVAKDIVERDFLSLKRDVTASEAASLMKSSRHGFAVILNEKGNPEGIVTEWDFLAKIVGDGKDATRVKLGEIMSMNLVTVKAEDGLDKVAQVMSEKEIRRVLVTQGSKVIGVITARIMLKRLKEYIDKVSSQIARLQAPNI
jgi:CBS domain-containing protein